MKDLVPLSFFYIRQREREEAGIHMKEKAAWQREWTE
jgi:hypothetical protein